MDNPNFYFISEMSFRLLIMWTTLPGSSLHPSVTQGPLLLFESRFLLRRLGWPSSLCELVRPQTSASLTAFASGALE